MSLHRTRTARINGSRLVRVISGQRHSNIIRVIIITHTHNALASFIRREGHLYEDFYSEPGLKLN